MGGDSLSRSVYSKQLQEIINTQQQWKRKTALSNVLLDASLQCNRTQLIFLAVVENWCCVEVKLLLVAAWKVRRKTSKNFPIRKEPLPRTEVWVIVGDPAVSVESMNELWRYRLFSALLLLSLPISVPIGCCSSPFASPPPIASFPNQILSTD